MDQRASLARAPRLSKAAVMVAGDRATSSNGDPGVSHRGEGSRESQPTAHLGNQTFLENVGQL